MKLKINLLLLILVTSFSFFGCSRPKQETTSKINLNFGGAPSQKVGSLSECSGVCLYHVILNVSGPGFPGIDLSVDAEDLNNGSLSIEVPSGSDRLFQLIAVYYDTANSSMLFYYGDSVQTLSGGTKDIALDVKALNQSSSEQGHIAGRWLGNDVLPKFPTGELRVMYRPPNGRPAMTIEKSMMVTGWFSAFSIQGINFDYVVKTLSGETVTIFENTNFESFAVGPKILKIRLPSHFDDGNSEQPVNYVYGFFGSPVHTVSKSVCYENIAFSLDRFKKADQTSYTWAELVKSGGTASYTACGGSSFPYQTDSAIKVFPHFLENGKDSSGGFLGILAGQINNDNFQLVSTTPGSFSLAALPGASTIFDKAVLFTLPEDKREVFGDGRLPCDALARGEHGALRRGELSLLPFGTVATGSHNISMAESNLPYAVCPSTQGRVVNGGYFSKGSGSSWPQPSPVPMAANDFDIYTYPKARQTQCRPVRVQLKNANQFAVADSLKNISLSASGVTVALYSDSSCTNPLANPYNLTFNSGEGQKDFFYNVSGGSNLLIESTSANNSFSISKSSNIQIESAGGTATKIISLKNSVYLSPNQCQEVELMSLDASDFPTNRGVTDTYTVTSNLPGDFKLVDSCATKNAVGNFSFSSSDYIKRISILAGPNNFSNAQLSFSGAYSIAPVYGNISPTVGHLTIEIKKSSLPVVNLFQEECYEVRVRSNVNNGPTFPIPVKIHATGGQFYNASGCAGLIGVTTDLSLGVSVDMTPTVYLKTNSGSNLTINFDGAHNPFLSNPSANLALNSTLLGLNLGNLSRWFQSINATPAWASSVNAATATFSSLTQTSDANLLPYGANKIEFTDGTSNFLNLSPVTLGNSSFSFLIYISGSNVNKSIGKYHNSSQGVATYISTNATGFLQIGSNISSGTLNSGQWYFVTIVRTQLDASNQSFDMYLNGSQILNGSVLNGTNYGLPVDQYILGLSSSFGGFVAETLLNDVAFNPTDALNLYQYMKAKYPNLSLP